MYSIELKPYDFALRGEMNCWIGQNRTAKFQSSILTDVHVTLFKSSLILLSGLKQNKVTSTCFHFKLISSRLYNSILTKKVNYQPEKKWRGWGLPRLVKCVLINRKAWTKIEDDILQSKIPFDFRNKVWPQIELKIFFWWKGTRRNWWIVREKVNDTLQCTARLNSKSDCIEYWYSVMLLEGRLVWLEPGRTVGGNNCSQAVGGCVAAVTWAT